MYRPRENRYVLPSIIDLDELFSRTPNTLVFNEVMLDKEPDKVLELICDISADNQDSVASCECGDLVGNYYKGIKCKKCQSVCRSDLFGEIRNDSWLEIPLSIQAVLNPQVYRILADWMGSVKKQNILSSILNMQLPQEPIPNTPFFTSMGFNWFYDNFGTVIDFFCDHHPTASKRKSGPMIRKFLFKTGKAIWCRKLPILSKLLQPITKVSKGLGYADTDIDSLIKCIFTIRSVLLTERMMKFSPDHVDRHFFKVYIEFINYTTNILTHKLARKESILRKHVFGSRVHCSARSVAIPITEAHESDEVYFPWKIGVVVYKHHLWSILTNRLKIPGFRAYNRIMNAINVYDHEIDLIMQQMIRECPYKGLPVLVNRNPSLRTGSIQLMYVTKIKPALKQNPLPTLVDDTPVFINLNPNDRTDDFVPNDGFYFDMDKGRMVDRRGTERRETNDPGRRRVENGGSIPVQLDDLISPNGIITAGINGDIESEIRPISSSSFFGMDEDNSDIYHKITSYIEDGAIAVSPMIVKGPNLD